MSVKGHKRTSGSDRLQKAQSWRNALLRQIMMMIPIVSIILSLNKKMRMIMTMKMMMMMVMMRPKEVLCVCVSWPIQQVVSPNEP